MCLVGLVDWTLDVLLVRMLDQDDLGLLSNVIVDCMLNCVMSEHISCHCERHDLYEMVVEPIGSGKELEWCEYEAQGPWWSDLPVPPHTTCCAKRARRLPIKKFSRETWPNRFLIWT